jgi:hypothetical protein
MDTTTMNNLEDSMIGGTVKSITSYDQSDNED